MEIYVGQCSKEQKLLSPQRKNRESLLLNTDARLNGAYSETPVCWTRVRAVPTLLPPPPSTLEPAGRHPDQARAGLQAHWHAASRQNITLVEHTGGSLWESVVLNLTGSDTLACSRG